MSYQRCGGPPISLDGYVPTTQKAAANGVATLGSDSKVPSSQLDVVSLATKGDIAVETATGLVAQHVSGTDGNVLTEDSTSPTGLSYKPQLETTPTEGHSAGAELWANLASARSAVRIVLCGHVDADYDGAQIVRHRTNTRGDGTVCHQIECNYQYQVPYGGGWVSDLRFDEANQNLSYEAYSPYYGQVRYRSQDRFALVMP
jgi:hypothetical protein